MSLFGAILVLACLVFVSFHYWDRLAAKEEKVKTRKWFRNWAIKGLGLPILGLGVVGELLRLAELYMD